MIQHHILNSSTGKVYAPYRVAKKNPHFVALGRNGGKARNVALLPERRSEIARDAINARWDRVRAERAAVSGSKKVKRGRVGAMHVQ